MTVDHYQLPYYVKVLQDLELLVAENIFEKTTIISGLTYHSKDVEENSLYICKGSAFKVEYLKEAIKKGAVGYVSEVKYDVGEDIPYILVKDIQQAMAPLASTFYNHPQDKLKIIGIGGTKGKTTTSYFFKAVLDKYLKSQEKKPAGIISSIITYDGLEETDSANTTPEAVELIKHLANAVAAGLEYFILEVSSQALKYHRTAGLIFELGVFLNIDEDHISPIEHPNYEDYVTSKLKMFKQTKHLVVNNETADSDRVFTQAKQVAKYYDTFSLISEQADYLATNIQVDGFQTSFSVRTKKWQEAYRLSMPGLFNVENALAVIAGIDILNIPQKYAQTAFAAIRVPGRTEFYQTADEKIIAVVDYAHNRLSFQRLYDSIRETHPNHRIVSVFGAPGGKALGRREELGNVAGIYSDEIYLTMDDPGDEKVSAIAEEIAIHIKKHDTPYMIIENRSEAIKQAFSNIQEQTAILVMGKGQDASNIIKGKAVPYKSDLYYVQKYLAEYNKGHQEREVFK